MNNAELYLLFSEFIDKTKVYRDKLNPTDARMFLCDINTLKKTIVESEKGCVEHGYFYPCPVCDGESDS